MSDQTHARVLVVDDEIGMADLLTRIIKNKGHEVTAAHSAEEAEKRLAEDEYDLVLTDMVLKGKGGDHLVRHIKERHPDAEVIVITAHASVDSAIEIMKLGAFDYLRKPLLPEEILHAVNRALEIKGLRDEVKILRKEKETNLTAEKIIGRSLALRKIYEIIKRVARTDATVLLEGESGTGKEIFARAIHEGSARAKGPFIAINCGAIPGELLETELFGHARGAFTGAVKERLGYFETAHGGTLLLDEIGEMETRLQVKLLRVLQEGQITKIGENKTRPVDVRIVASTNKTLKNEVALGNFRSDLYYRLNVVHIKIPPLRERKEDILPLAYTFMKRYSEKYGKKFQDIDPKTALMLQRYDYPGNVRELENIMESAVAIGSGKNIRPDHIRDALGIDPHQQAVQEARTDIPFEQALEQLSDQFEKTYLANMLARHQGKIANIIKVSGLSRRTIERKMKKHGLDREEFTSRRGN